MAIFDLVVTRAALLVLILSGVPLAVSAGGGLLVSILQAVTQIQEQCVSFVVKIALVVTVIFFFGRIGMDLLCGYVQQVLEGMAHLGRLA